MKATTITLSRKARWAIGIAGACLLVAGTGIAVASWQYSSFDKVDFDPGSARETLERQGQEEEDGDLIEDVELDGGIERDDGLLATLVLGSDAREGDTSARADAIMLVVIPPNEREPVIASIPRDLWVDNPCTGGKTRINAGLNGCGDEISGTDLMTVMIEDLAGIEIDHYAEVDFDGFISIVDAFGGVEICTDHPVRDRRAELELPGGCVQASGDEALAWARSRHTQELVDGDWRIKPGVNALSRDERQQELALEVAERISKFDSIGGLRSVATGLRDSVRLDSGMSLTRAVALAWEYRNIDTDGVQRISLPVSDYTTSDGAQVVRAEASLTELLAEALDKDKADLAGDD